MSFPRLPIPKKKFEDFELDQLFGRGNFVSVYRCFELNSEPRKPYAMKIVDKYRAERLKKQQDLVMEKHCLLRVNHPNIIKMIYHFQDMMQLYVIMEDCACGELWESVKGWGCPMQLAKHYLMQVVNACDYLRRAGIVHRDLKGENILIAARGVIKIIDFGTAKDLENPHIKGSGNKARNKTFDDYVGTPQFMPPEVIENKFTDFRSDTWSLGCTFYQVFAGVPPFHGPSEYLIYTKIMDAELCFPPGIHPDVIDIVKRMTIGEAGDIRDADNRLGAKDLSDIRNHALFKGCVFKDAHKQPVPVVGLTDLCLQHLARKYKEGDFRKQMKQLESDSRLDAQMQERLKGIRVVKKWEEDATPVDQD